MKKIIVAIDGLKYSLGTYKTAVYLAKQSGAHLVGAFLEDVTYHSYKIHELVGEDGVSEDKRNELEERDTFLRKSAVEVFEDLCAQANVGCRIHHDRNVAINELLHESIFADMILINSKETLTHYSENIPTRFIRSLLSEAQCPVMVIPDDYEPIDTLAFLYDGEPSSVHAIKTFSYLFPGLGDKKAEVVSVNTGSPKKPFTPNGLLMKEFMKRHYPKASYVTMQGIPETEIVRHFQYARNTVIVLGAYRRSNMSRWFKPSLADCLMQELKLPLFIAHT